MSGDDAVQRASASIFISMRVSRASPKDYALEHRELTKEKSREDLLPLYAIRAAICSALRWDQFSAPRRVGA